MAPPGHDSPVTRASEGFRGGEREKQSGFVCWRVCERLGDQGKQALAVHGTLTFISTAASSRVIVAAT